jgi:hypothetical protein
MDPWAVRISGEDQDPARIYRGGVFQPRSVRLKAALVQGEDLLVQVAVPQRLGRDLEKVRLLPIAGRRTM